jgi:hypothetical protein
MKLIDNTKKSSILTKAIFITAAFIFATSAIMFTNTYAQTCPAETAKVLKDSTEANGLGWNPDGNQTRFLINEACYSDAKSVVLVNLKDGDIEGPEWNTEVCNVDYSEDGIFEVYCDNAPFEGSELRYVVSDHELQVIGEQAETQTPTDSQRGQNPARASQ